jgi:hypothetical protein
LQINLADLKAILHTPVLIDGRKIFDADKVQEAGFYYRCIGESYTLSKKVNSIL